MLDTNQSVADLVLEHSECAAVFQRFRIDFCCRGQMSVKAAAAQRKVELDALTTELSKAIEERRGDEPADMRTLSTPQLIEHIVSTHHAYLRSVLPFVRTLSSKVARVHGDHNPKLRELDAKLEVLEGALLPHLDEEEQVLFPRLIESDDPAALEPLLASMLDEHRAVGDLLASLREASDDFTPPAWACGSYRTLLAELGELEHDVHVHVHIENNVLAPRFARAANVPLTR